MRIAIGAVLLLLSGCGFIAGDRGAGNTFYTALPRLKTLDPALADDVASGLAVGHLYDRLLQYDYEARPYRLVPSMAAAMPEVSADGLTVTFRLRDDLRFPADPCFDAPGAASASHANPVVASDVVYSLLRLADARLHSPGYWILRGRLAGLDAFRDATAAAPPGDYSLYAKGIAGLQAPDAHTVVVRLTGPYPQLLHVLAMPYASIVPAAAICKYGSALAEHPVGSGPFRLAEWRRNYRFVLVRNPDFRLERGPAGPRRLPALDRVVAYVVQEPLTAWLLFLQGNLDLVGLNQENMDSALSGTLELTPALRARGIRLHQIQEYQINYVGFNLRDPLLGGNRKLRQALSLAYDTPTRIRLANGQLLPAQGPIPPGVQGHDGAWRNEFAQYDLARARALLAEAGFPGGIDPASGRALHLRLDLGGTDLARRQQAELLAADLKRLGIEIEPTLSNLPRFFDKVQRGDVQLFRLSWVGDYPDAQNYLQLFYGPNAGSCNRACYREPAVDVLYEQAAALPDGPERTALYRRLEARIADDCPWIFESFPVRYYLVQPWVEGYIPHHYAYDGWKYLRIQDAGRRAGRKQARPAAVVAPLGAGG